MPADIKALRRLLREGKFDEFRASITARATSEGQHKRAVQKVGNINTGIENHVFVCGLHRSGTTLIHDLLFSRYDLCRLRGPVPESEGQHLQNVFPSETAFGGVGRFAFSAEMHALPSNDPATVAAQRSKMEAQWAPWIIGDATTLIEKSPPNLTRIPLLRALFPGAKFVIWTRHPYAVTAASRKWCKIPDAELLLHWSVAHSSALQAVGDDCIIARYEDFCDDPDNEVSRIAQFLDLSARDTPLDPGERFMNVQNSNEKYLKEFPAVQYKHRKIWRYFGY